MSAAELQKPIYHNEDAALAHFEAVRWPEGPVCFHCGSTNVKRLEGKSTRKGLFQCREKECRGQFTAVMGSVFEKSHIPLHKWLLATHLLCSSKKGMSALQLHRELGFGSYRTAWFMSHRIREAMKPAAKPGSGGLPPLGGKDKIVEADETYFGKVKEPRTKRTDGKPYLEKGSRGPKNKRAIVALVERGGEIRTFHVPTADKFTVMNIVRSNVARSAKLATDESRLYVDIGHVAEHGSVKHTAGQYVNGWVHTNTLEGYFSIFKRGMRGIYQHCSEKHLHRYLAEYDFRYNTRAKLGFNDSDRTTRALEGAIGKRLTYRRPEPAGL